MYEIQPILEKKDAPNEGAHNGESKTELHTIPSVKYSYLALSQRKLEFVPRPFLHPFEPCVFGSPLLVRVRDLEGYTGNDLHKYISQRIRRFVPFTPTTNDCLESSSDMEAVTPNANMAKTARVPWQTRRQHRHKTTADMESLSSGEIPPYGFRLRLVSRDGTQCALCKWFSCCVGCLIPCDDYPTVAMCGDSISIDWHMSVDLSGGAFGWDVTNIESTGINVHTSPHSRALTRVKKHSSFNTSGKKYGYSGSISLEECLDSFAKEEKIPEVSLYMNVCI